MGPATLIHVVPVNAQDMRASVETLDGARDRLTATVAALEKPASYPEETRGVERIETHMSFVFLTDRHAYKLKKPIRTALLDHTTLGARQRGCETELELNRRLAADVYLDVVPVAGAGGALRVDGPGEVIDWLVKMRRLPSEQMLDARIERGDVELADVDRIAEVLALFYAGAQRCPLSGAAYRDRIIADIDAKRASLAQPRYRLSDDDIEAVVRGQRRWLERRGDLLDARAARLVDAHGDLRPEHVCLEETGPRIIDCIEFDPELRVLDPISELSFLGLECRRLGASWVGERLLSGYGARSGDRAPAPLVRFYQSTHALVRAAIAVWHLDDDSLDHSDRWRLRAGWYLRVARELL